MPFTKLEPYGWNGHWAAVFAEATATAGSPTEDRRLPGRIVRHDGVALVTALPDGLQTLHLSRNLSPPPAVGDWLVVEGEVPVQVLPRTSVLTRRALRGGAPQSLAANVDVVLVVCGLDRPLSPGRIDRTITLARDAGAVPVVVLNKADHASAVDATVARVAATHPGARVLATSTVSGHGIEALRTVVADHTVVMVGQSGAGKSSLTNALIGDDVAVVGEVRDTDAKGRHTTTTREAHVLPGGGVLIDTPGLREVGLWADTAAVSAAFADVENLAARCRFSDCAHTTEPGCAVIAAVDAGDLAAERFAAWRELEDEAADLAEQAEQRRWRSERRSGRLSGEQRKHRGR